MFSCEFCDIFKNIFLHNTFETNEISVTNQGSAILHICFRFFFQQIQREIRDISQNKKKVFYARPGSRLTKIKEASQKKSRLEVKNKPNKLQDDFS